WNDATLYREAQEIAGLLPDLIAQDKMFDVMAGTAGCLMSLLSLYAVAPTPELLALALQCGDRLVATASVQDQGIGWCPIPNVPPLAGMAHGNAGIALALLRLAAISGEKRFVTTAQGALEYERLLYVPERGNWLDLRPDTIEDALRNNGGQQHKDAHFMVGWCNGAPGIALARIGSLQVWPNAQMRTELEAALHTTIAHGFGMNHSLCHGDMGHLDILLSAVQFGADTAYKEAVQHLAPMLLESIETQGWITGVPQGVETPGLMVGITGIGYALLRLASPTQVPSVLLLSEPIK
ncbi:MAG TPA: lanthionine synthetase LanC family protein, partial [Ktedonobacteraceae bacterium]|nr:lanthionine synthetase LanC family protein [Ktedonobacteraceae bacterium]